MLSVTYMVCADCRTAILCGNDIPDIVEDMETIVHLLHIDVEDEGEWNMNACETCNGGGDVLYPAEHYIVI